ncbi:RluA family pseudouridine synthase [Thiomicrorhabdus arctica]|jgi:tRNA pseudouridine32 synthase/23S rRNA pseudouridine746 synthase|uniref:RluA family pseudouridine synthase n=1 Tax=Thiomicrorhabdus arctica TaxID=131540 RepID=UPI00037F5BE0|nr:RNA pseudouridine synthase [Thiomicrorhabdus arctica]
MNTKPTQQHYNLTIEHPGDALEHLAEQTGLSKQQLKTYALKGAVWLTQFSPSKPSKPERLRRLKKALLPGMILDFYYFPELLNAEQPPAQLIEDKQGYSVWLKPRGMLSQGSKWGDHTALYRWVEMHYKPNNETRQAWIVHRLDRATQGVMLLAHTKRMAQTLSHTFESRQIHKSYQANVWGEFPVKAQTINLAIDDKTAISHVRLITYNAKLNISRVEVDIETGRKHQIRRHLSASGFPIIGDRLYGDESLDLALQANGESRPDLQLTAYKLSFVCPLSQQVTLYVLTEQQLDLMTVE